MVVLVQPVRNSLEKGWGNAYNHSCSPFRLETFQFFSSVTMANGDGDGGGSENEHDGQDHHGKGWGDDHNKGRGKEASSHTPSSTSQRGAASPKDATPFIWWSSRSTAWAVDACLCVVPTANT